MRPLAPFAFSFIFVGLVVACGDPPRTVALLNEASLECADPVTMTDSSTTVSASPDEVAMIEVDDDRATVMVMADCTINGVDRPLTCNIVFGPDGTQSVRVEDGSRPTDLAVFCPSRAPVPTEDE